MSKPLKRFSKEAVPPRVGGREFPRRMIRSLEEYRFFLAGGSVAHVFDGEERKKERRRRSCLPERSEKVEFTVRQLARTRVHACSAIMIRAGAALKRCT